MKTAICIILTMWAAVLRAGLPDDGGRNGVEVSDVKIEKNARQCVTVEFTLMAGKMDLGSQQTVRLVPVLAEGRGGHCCELPAVVVSGKARKVAQQRNAMRRHAPACTDADTLAFRPGMAPYRYRAEVPFRSWMAGGRFLLRCFLSGCRDCPQGDRTVSFTGVRVLDPPVPQYGYAMIEGSRQTAKPARFTRLMTMSFRQNSSYIQPDWGDNADRLKQICDTIAQIEDDPYFEIRKIEVASFASPEGEEAYNRWMTERRAASFMRYLMERLPAIGDSLFCSRSGGEDWAGLRRLVTGSGCFADTAAALRIIDRRGTDPDRAQRQLEEGLSPDGRRCLYGEVYPRLRRNDYRVLFAVRNFSFEESRSLIGSRPELLDMFETDRLAKSLMPDEERVAKVWVEAALAHKDEPDFLHNAAVALLRCGNPERVCALLERAERPDLLNLRAVACALTGQTALAEQLFDRAAQGGDGQAARNREQLRRYVEFMAEKE